MLGELASKACAEHQHPYSRTDFYTANRFDEPLDPTAGYWRCCALKLIALGLVDDESPSRKAN
jgi:hypothetical protein